jgi:hypothetical protein
MEFPEIWAALAPDTQSWLRAHNGEDLPEAVMVELVAAGRGVIAGPWWDGGGPDGWRLTDRAVDWIEADSNGE